MNIAVKQSDSVWSRPRFQSTQNRSHLVCFAEDVFQF
jgi:hypothetical protein